VNLTDCAKLQRTPENGTWFRCIALGHLRTALSSAHTKKRSGRFNAGVFLPAHEQFAILSCVDDPLVAQFEVGAVFGSLQEKVRRRRIERGQWIEPRRAEAEQIERIDERHIANPAPPSRRYGGVLPLGSIEMIERRSRLRNNPRLSPSRSRFGISRQTPLPERVGPKQIMWRLRA
jgi:hypothetical protein